MEENTCLIPRRGNVPCAGCFQLHPYLAIHASIESGLKSEYLKLVGKKEGEPQFLPSLDHPPNPTTPRHVRATASGRISPD